MGAILIILDAVKALAGMTPVESAWKVFLSFSFKTTRFGKVQPWRGGNDAGAWSYPAFPALSLIPAAHGLIFQSPWASTWEFGGMGMVWSTMGWALPKAAPLKCKEGENLPSVGSSAEPCEPWKFLLNSIQASLEPSSSGWSLVPAGKPRPGWLFWGKKLFKLENTRFSQDVNKDLSLRWTSQGSNPSFSASIGILWTWRGPGQWLSSFL